ncbi:MAG: hypothetical protein AAF791_02940 [Bacteroidota bacterium]
MLTATPTGLLSKHFAFARDGRPLGTIRQSGVREKGEIVLDGVPYSFQNQLVGRDFLLESDGRVLARAKKRTLRRAFDVTLDLDGMPPRPLALEVSGAVSFMKGGRYSLSEAGRPLGQIIKTPLARSARATFPDDLPEPVQVFLLWIALMMWRREQS